ncbi:unnamed protein product [Pylaiella littoralis]
MLRRAQQMLNVACTRGPAERALRSGGPPVLGMGMSLFDSGKRRENKATNLVLSKQHTAEGQKYSKVVGSFFRAPLWLTHRPLPFFRRWCHTSKYYRGSSRTAVS